MIKNYIAILLFFPCFASAQLKIAAGTKVEIDSATTLFVKNGSVDTIKIESGSNVINNGKLLLSPLTLLSEQPGFPITGKGFEQFANFYTAPLTLVNPGGLGFVISTVISPDSLEIKRSRQILNNGASNSIARNYEVKSRITSNLDATIEFNYDVTELNSIDPAALVIYEKNAVDWKAIAGKPYTNVVRSEAGVINSFSHYSLFDFGLKLDSLNATTFRHGDSLKIYYSINGILNSGNKLMFELSDKFGDFSNPTPLMTLTENKSGVARTVIPSSIPFGNLYRMRFLSTDIAFVSPDNGKNIVILDSVITSLQSLSANEIIVYPNPTKGIVNIKGDNITKIIVKDQLGRYLQVVSYPQGNGSYYLNIQSLEPAVYLLEIQTGVRFVYMKIIKE